MHIEVVRGDFGGLKTVRTKYEDELDNEQVENERASMLFCSQ